MYSDDYYIVFCEAERKRWYLRYLKPGFGHCFLIKPDKGKWIKYESGDGVTRVDISDNYDKYTKDSIMVKIKSREAKGLFCLNTCVGFVKLVTGFGGWAFTPYQLFKKVNKRVG